MFEDSIGAPLRLLAAPLRVVASGLDFALRVLGAGEALQREGAAVPDDDAPSPGEREAATEVPRRTELRTRLRIVHSRRAPESLETEPSPPLPAVADRDYVAVVPRSPETAFAFWVVSPESLGQARAEIEDPHAALAVRIRSRPPVARAERIVRARPGAETLYLGGLPPGAEITVEIGVASGGAFRATASASRTRLPARDLSVTTGARWRDHETGDDVESYATVAGIEAVSPRDLGRNLPPRPETGALVSVVTPAPNPRAVPARD